MQFFRSKTRPRSVRLMGTDSAKVIEKSEPFFKDIRLYGSYVFLRPLDMVHIRLSH